MHRVALLCLSLAPLDAGAVEDTLATAAEAAWERALQKVESSGRVAIAAADRRLASAWWADTPSLELSHRTGDWGNNPGERESEIAIAWPTWFPGQRAAHREAAAVESQLASIAEQDARLRVAGEVRALAWRIAALGAEERGVAQQAEYLDALAQDVDRRVSARELPRSDSLAARAESLNSQGAALQARRALETARAEWTLLTGLREIPDPSEEPLLTDVSRAVDEHPTVRHAFATAAHARAQLRAARRAPLDPPEVRVLYREEIAMEGLPVDRSIGIGLRVPLGWERNVSRNAAARSVADLADATAERMREAQQSAMTVAKAELEAAARRLEAAESRATLLRERVQLLEKSYRAGESSVLEILRERRGLTEAEIALARDRAGLGLAQARLRQALGMLP